MFKLLIAEDEPLERQALRFIFERSERNVRIVGEAKTGWQTVELANEFKPDIVFMDIKMPGIDGLQATKSIKQCHPSAKIVVLTAYGDFAYAQEALRLGAVDYVLKPAKPDDLLAVLDRAISVAESELRDRQVRESLKEAMPFVQMGFVSDLVGGNISNADEAFGRAQLVGLPTSPHLAMVIDIDHFSAWSSSLSETEKAIAKDEVFRLAKEAIHDNPDVLLVPQTADKLILLMCIPQDEGDDEVKPRAIDVAQRIRQAVQGVNSLSVTIGIGRAYAQPRDLKKSFDEASRAQRYKLFLGRNRIIHVDDIAAQSAVDSYPYERERELCGLVKAGDKQGAAKLASELLHHLVEGNARQPETVKACILELLVMASRAAIEGGADQEVRLSANLRHTQELVRVDTIEDLRTWLEQAIGEMAGAVLESHQLRNKRMVDRAIKFIRAHCTTELTLEQVAEAVNLSPFYFSRLFKQEQRCTFIEFLIKARVEEAKKLLRNTRLSITEISFHVGYQDPNYFSQVFRHAEGVTPSQYRRSSGKD